jgi:hypothetical protein
MITMNDPIMLLKGSKVGLATIEAYDDKVFFDQLGAPKKEIPYKDVVKVEYKKASLLNGHLYVSYGRNGSVSTVDMVHNTFASADMEKLRDIIQAKMSTGRTAAPPANTAAAPAANAGVPADRTLNDLNMLADLRDKGIITEEEFQAKKKSILFPEPAGIVREKEIIREIVKMPCAYCGALVEITAVKCSTCGAPFKR